MNPWKPLAVHFLNPKFSILSFLITKQTIQFNFLQTQSETYYMVGRIQRSKPQQNLRQMDQSQYQIGIHSARQLDSAEGMSPILMLKSL